MTWSDKMSEDPKLLSSGGQTNRLKYYDTETSTSHHDATAVMSKHKGKQYLCLLYTVLSFVGCKDQLTSASGAHLITWWSRSGTAVFLFGDVSLRNVHTV